MSYRIWLEDEEDNHHHPSQNLPFHRGKVDGDGDGRAVSSLNGASEPDRSIFDVGYRSPYSHGNGEEWRLDASMVELSNQNMTETSPEFSIFVGDLSPDLTEEDLVAQFLHPSPWPASHPFSISHAHSQQLRGYYGGIAKIRPAPFTSTKSAKIMKDPTTGVSRGFGFVRFSREDDCLRALIEMQGMIINPASGQGRPLRVSTATPKNRNTTAPSTQMMPQEDTLNLYQQMHLQQQRLSLPVSPSAHFPPASPPLRNSGFGIGHQSLPNETGGNTGSSSSQSYASSAADPGNTTVFVGGLSSIISEETLKTFFAPFGEIIYVKIPPGKGCGFVQFVRKVDAERAIERMQGFPIGGGRIRLSWGRSQGDKAAAAAAQAVAQSAQISHLANLAELGVLTPTQLSQLAGASLAANAAGPHSGDSNLILRQLAAAVSGANGTGIRERSATVNHLPAMEQQHRQAQQLSARAQYSPGEEMEQGYNLDGSARLHSRSNTLFSPYRTDKDVGGYNYGNEDYLASIFPSLQLEERESQNPVSDALPQKNVSTGSLTYSSSSPSTNSLTSPTQQQQYPFNTVEDQADRLRKQACIFSPFSPPISPTMVNNTPTLGRDSVSPLMNGDVEGRTGHANSFVKYLEAEKQHKEKKTSLYSKQPSLPPQQQPSQGQQHDQGLTLAQHPTSSFRQQLPAFFQ